MSTLQSNSFDGGGGMDTRSNRPDRRAASSVRSLPSRIGSASSRKLPGRWGRGDGGGSSTLPEVQSVFRIAEPAHRSLFLVLSVHDDLQVDLPLTGLVPSRLLRLSSFPHMLN